MRVLYVGQLWEGGTCLERMKVLREAGWTIFPLDTTPFLKAGGRWLAALQHRLSWGPDVTRFNEAVMNRTFLGKTRCGLGGQGALAACRCIERGQAWHWCHRRALHARPCFHRTRKPTLQCLPVAVRPLHHHQTLELETYSRHKARVLFTLQGIDDRFIRESACGRIDSRPIDLMFVGHREPHYERLLAAAGNAARSSGAKLRIFGSGWPDLRKSPNWRELVGGPVWGDAYALTLARARIGLGLLSKRCPDGFTTRTFEIPAAGSMLLAERTPEHQELFEEDSEAVFFGSIDELCEKIAFYHRNEAARRSIALAGRKRAIGQYHWRHVMQPAISLVRECTAQK